jgi:hypothetical protein
VISPIAAPTILPLLPGSGLPVLAVSAPATITALNMPRPGWRVNSEIGGLLQFPRIVSLPPTTTLAAASRVIASTVHPTASRTEEAGVFSASIPLSVFNCISEAENALLSRTHHYINNIAGFRNCQRAMAAYYIEWLVVFVPKYECDQDSTLASVSYQF